MKRIGVRSGRVYSHSMVENESIVNENTTDERFDKKPGDDAADLIVANGDMMIEDSSGKFLSFSIVAITNTVAVTNAAPDTAHNTIDHTYRVLLFCS
jgi:hypothetical protein